MCPEHAVWIEAITVVPMDVSPEQMDDGPDFDIDIEFRYPTWNPKDVKRGVKILDTLRIEGPWADIEQMGESRTLRNRWMSEQISYGLLRLSPRVTMGVKIIPPFERHPELRLAFPPRQVELNFGDYPWCYKWSWVTDEVVELHRQLIDLCRSLNAACAVRIASLYDEAWAISIPDELCGILVYSEVAEAANWKGNSMSRFTILPW